MLSGSLLVSGFLGPELLNSIINPVVWSITLSAS